MAGLVYSREIHKYLRGPSRNIYGTPQGTVQHAEQRKCLRGDGGGIHCEFLNPNQGGRGRDKNLRSC